MRLMLCLAWPMQQTCMAIQLAVHLGLRDLPYAVCTCASPVPSHDIAEAATTSATDLREGEYWMVHFSPASTEEHRE